MVASAPPLPAATDDECRRCRAARSIARIVLFMVVGVVVALAVSWVTTRVPALGIALAILGVLGLLRTLVRLFSSLSPTQALMRLGVSLGIGFATSTVVGFVVTSVMG